MKQFNMFLKTSLVGVGQVMFQENYITGLLFLVGIAINSYIMALGAIIGAIIGLLTAKISKFKKEDIDAGLYGFNSVLLSIALLFIYEPTLIIFIFIILGSVICTYLMHFMFVKKLYPFTFPFILISWLLVWVINFYKLGSDAISSSSLISITVNNLYLSALSMSFSEVFFQANFITGIIFIIGIIYNSKSNGIKSLFGVILALIISVLFNLHNNSIIIGLFGFNAVLCAIALDDKSKSSYLYISLATIISIVLMLLFMSNNLIFFTAPFVFATWITIFIKNALKSKNSVA